MRYVKRDWFSLYVLMGVLVFSIPFWGGKAESQDGELLPQSLPETVTSDDDKLTGTGGDPISMATGEYFFFMGLFNLGGPLPLTYRMYYGSQVDSKTDPFDGFPNTHFSSNHGRYLNVFKVPGVAFVETGLGKEIGFTKSGTVWTVSMHKRIRYQLKETTNYFYMLDPQNHLVFSYVKTLDNTTQTRAMLVRVEDRNGNAITYTKSGNDDIISDGLGRQLTLTLNQASGSWYATQVKDQANRTYTFTYENSPVDNPTLYTLRSITDPMGNITRFTYSGNDRMISKQFPVGNTPYTQTYDTTTTRGIVASQTDAYGNTSSITKLSYDPYNQRESQFRITYPDGTTRTFVHDHYSRVMKSITDAAGKTATFTADEFNPVIPGRDQITGVGDREGDSTLFAYHGETGYLASVTNAKGNSINYTYASQNQTFTNPVNLETLEFPFYNHTGTNYPDGTNEQFTYDAKGNRATHIDPAGRTRTYTYNDKGQVLTITNPTGGVITRTYNADGTLASSRDSDTGTTTYGYDTYKRLNQITRPDGKTILIACNLNDQITSITDENNHTYAYQYDANGNLIKITDPAGRLTQYAYDLMDRVNAAADRLFKLTTYAYDNMERPSSITDRNGIATSLGYNSRGWPNQVTLGGQTWQRGYDDEGILSSSTTPLGHTTNYQSDKLGYLTGVTNPLGQTTAFIRDFMSRITGKTDPLGRTTTYGFDGRGLLSSVTLPVVGTATYQRNDLGFLSRITDLNSQNWTFGYTSMGRPNSSADPLGNTWNQTYDTRGRPSQTTYPDGSTLSRTYDDAGNLTRMLHSGGPDMQYAYNQLNGLTGANGITFTRDDENRITATDNPGTVFGATYDDGGRLSTATYPSTGSGQAFTVTYTYNATTGLLSRVTDSLTSTQIDFIYDNDGRPTGITRSNGVNTTLAWDNASRLTRIQDGSIIDLQYTLDAAGQVTGLNMTVPLDPASLLQSATESFSYDAASRVSTAGYSYDQRGRQTAMPGQTFTWDGASRLTGIAPSTGSGQAALAYNGLGDLMTRTESGNTIHYYYNYAIGLKPIVAEKNDSTGQFLRYYVWTPEGSLLYMIDAANSNKVYFYHFDRTGSTLALTNSAGTVTDKYAYDPYGELLSHQGSNPQPFTFVGRYGVRQEGASGTLYHMRARYYDAITQRFISREPLWPNIANPASLNPYQYALQAPVKYMDITGLNNQEQVPKNDIGIVILPDGRLIQFGSMDAQDKLLNDLQPPSNRYGLVQLPDGRVMLFGGENAVADVGNDLGIQQPVWGFFEPRQWELPSGEVYIGFMRYEDVMVINALMERMFPGARKIKPIYSPTMTTIEEIAGGASYGPTHTGRREIPSRKPPRIVQKPDPITPPDAPARQLIKLPDGRMVFFGAIDAQDKLFNDLSSFHGIK